MNPAPRRAQAARDGSAPRGVLSLAGVDPARVHREWQVTNTLWALVQRLVALLLIVLALPTVLLLYLPVRVSARAPFFFRQKRPGFMGREFTIWKITTMRAGSDRVAKYEKGVTLDDPNVTRIGRFLRDTKIDELPQLWNVVRGEMELVGPRPIAPGLNRMLCAEIPGFNQRYLVKPGLTNVSQVSVLENALDDRTVADWKLRFEGELHYIRNKSVSYDLILIALTVVFVLRKAVRRVFRPARRTGRLVHLPGAGASGPSEHRESA
jgi:lipopolysaccharide/colanic/teichoic acid biosynthesis glycosyltransferase